MLACQNKTLKHGLERLTVDVQMLSTASATFCSRQAAEVPGSVRVSVLETLLCCAELGQRIRNSDGISAGIHASIGALPTTAQHLGPTRFDVEMGFFHRLQSDA